MVSLKTLSSYQQFGIKTSASFVERLLSGDSNSVELKEEWGLDNLNPEDKAIVSKMYSMLGLSSKDHFVQLYTTNGKWTPKQVWAPCVMLNKEGQLCLCVGWRQFPITMEIDHKKKSVDFSMFTWVQGSDVAVETPLGYQINKVKTADSKEISQLLIVLPLDDNGDTTIEFPVIAANYEDDSFVKAISTRKVNGLMELMLTKVAISKISTGTNICNINKLLLSVFEGKKWNGKSLMIPVRGFKYHDGEYPAWHIEIDVTPIIDTYGDYDVLAFGKTTIKLSAVKFVSVKPEYISVLGAQSQPGFMVIDGPNPKNITYWPPFTLTLASHLPEAIQKSCFGQVYQQSQPLVAPAKSKALPVAEVIDVSDDDLGWSTDAH